MGHLLCLEHGTWNEIGKSPPYNAIGVPAAQLLHDMTITWLDHSTVSHIWPDRLLLPSCCLSVRQSLLLSCLFCRCLHVCLCCSPVRDREGTDELVRREVACRRRPSAGAVSSSCCTTRARPVLNKEKYLCVDESPCTYTPAGLHNTDPWKAKNSKFKSNSKSKSSSHHFMMKNVQDSNSGASIGIGEASVSLCTHTHTLTHRHVCICVQTHVDLFWSNIERVSPRQVDLSSALIFNNTNCWLKHLEFSMADSNNNSNNLFILLLFVHVSCPCMFMSQFSSYIELWFYLFIGNCIWNNLVALFHGKNLQEKFRINICMYSVHTQTHSLGHVWLRQHKMWNPILWYFDICKEEIIMS